MTEEAKRGDSGQPEAGLAPAPTGLEALIPFLMRPVIFALMNEKRDLSALRPASLFLDDEFLPLPRAAERLRDMTPERSRQPEPQIAHALPRAAQQRALDVASFRWATEREEKAAPLPDSLRFLGVAKPESFRIDEEGRVPCERDALKTTSERDPPPRPGRYLRPRTQIARAPLSRVDGTAFRLDRKTLALPNESIIEARVAPQLPSWYLEAYDRDFYRRWTPFIDIWGLGPMQTEWFSYWWAEFRAEKLGGQLPFEFVEDREIKWMVILRVKEQMMIRRDVMNLKEPQEMSEFIYEVQGVAIQQHERAIKLAELIDKPAWIDIARVAPDRREPLHPWQDAYTDWRALVSGLEEQPANAGASLL